MLSISTEVTEQDAQISARVIIHGAASKDCEQLQETL